MASNYKTLSDFEVATAAEAQSYFMDQAIIKVDTAADLTGLPTSVKTAYVLNTGVLMARDVANAWVPQGGAAAVSETAPANPQTGALWVKPSEVLPVPVRAILGSFTGALTTTYANLTGLSTIAITLPKACMVAVTMSSNVNVVGTATCDAQARLVLSGAIATDTETRFGNAGIMYGWANGTTNTTTSSSKTMHIVLPAGTTTFTANGKKSTSATTNAFNNVHVSLTPIQWADAYDAGVT